MTFDLVSWFLSRGSAVSVKNNEWLTPCYTARTREIRELIRRSLPSQRSIFKHTLRNEDPEKTVSLKEPCQIGYDRAEYPQSNAGPIHCRTQLCVPNTEWTLFVLDYAPESLRLRSSSDWVSQQQRSTSANPVGYWGTTQKRHHFQGFEAGVWLRALQRRNPW